MVRLDLAALQQPRRLQGVEGLAGDLVGRPRGERRHEGLRPRPPPVAPVEPGRGRRQRQQDRDPRQQGDDREGDRQRPLDVADVAALVPPHALDGDGHRLGREGRRLSLGVHHLHVQGRKRQLAELERRHLQLEARLDAPVRRRRRLRGGWVEELERRGVDGVGPPHFGARGVAHRHHDGDGIAHRCRRGRHGRLDGGLDRLGGKRIVLGGGRSRCQRDRERRCQDADRHRNGPARCRRPSAGSRREERRERCQHSSRHLDRFALRLERTGWRQEPRCRHAIAHRNRFARSRKNRMSRST